MFINSKKCFEIREGNQRLVIPCNFIGNIPDWAASHWLVQAAIRDGSISTPDSTKDRALEAADKVAREKAEEYDMRPKEEPEAAEEPEKRPERKARINHKEVPAWMGCNLME